jgi:hypothetical protein
MMNFLMLTGTTLFDSLKSATKYFCKHLAHQDVLILSSIAKPWGHWAGLKLRCDFAQIVGITGFDLF